MTMKHALFDRSRSCVVVIDVQQYFLDKLPPELAATPAIKPGSRGLK